MLFPVSASRKEETYRAAPNTYRLRATLVKAPAPGYAAQQQTAVRLNLPSNLCVQLCSANSRAPGVPVARPHGTMAAHPAAAGGKREAAGATKSGSSEVGSTTGSHGLHQQLTNVATDGESCDEWPDESKSLRLVDRGCPNTGVQISSSNSRRFCMSSQWTTGLLLGLMHNW